MKKWNLLLILIYLTGLPALVAQKSSYEFQVKYDISIEAFRYLEDAISLMEEGSIQRHFIDWNALRQSTYEKARGAHYPRDTYEAIKHAITLLGDKHSFFSPPEEMEELHDERRVQEAAVQIESRLIDDSIGYISIPGFIFLSAGAIQDFACSIQQHIQTLDEHKLQRWIVDLRKDFGGNMDPMLLGLRPLIGDGIVGYFCDGSAETVAWYFAGSAFYYGAYKSLDLPSYQLYESNPAIALLVGSGTGSSGEVTAISFLGKEHVRLFGQKTAGLTTANEMMRLSDGAAIFLATTYEADRTGRIYLDGITPDEEVIDADGDNTLQAAIHWLQGKN